VVVHDYYLAKNVSIPQGSSMEFIDGGAKVVLYVTGDAVKGGKQIQLVQQIVGYRI
jgi:hypothetical protein